MSSLYEMFLTGFRKLVGGAVVAGTICAASPVSAELLWGVPAPGEHRHASAGNGHGHGGGQGYYLSDSDGAHVQLWLPTLERREVTVSDGRAVLRPSGVDYYHALVAVRETGSIHEGAIRYIAMRGKLSGVSPARLLAEQKLPLEIVPDPLPREHWRYLTGRVAVFSVRFEGRPLAGQTVGLETGNGTRLFANTDTRGHVAFPLPEDFTDVTAGRRGNSPGEFVLRTSYEHKEKRYRSSLSATYYVNPGHWQSVNAGLLGGTAGFGVGLGILVLARPRSAAKRG